MPKGKNKKKKSSIIQVSIGILAVILAILIIIMMGIVSDIQGTARIVNYTGLVRGETQRIIKLEVSMQQQNEMIHEIRSFIDGLRNGNDKLNLVRLNDIDFQNKMQELDEKFSDLYKKIYLMRFKGSENTDIISESEEFFLICDEATGLAEKYSQKKATSLSLLEKYIIADIIVLMLLIGYEFIKAIQYAAMNRLLQRKVYLDAATGLPNKNKCEELLNETEPAADTGVCSFDLNNLRRINDSRGHEAGDVYIRRFAVCLRASMPAEQFVGRYGGDEFLAVTHGLDREQMTQCLENIRREMGEESKEYPDTPLSYAAGFALACDFPESTMRELFNYADKNMYINKNHVKREEAAAEKHRGYQLLKLLNQHGSNFSDCLYCDARMDTYRTIRSSENFFLAAEGTYSSAAEQIVDEQMEKSCQADIRKGLQIQELQKKMRTKEDVQEFEYDTGKKGTYNRLTLIPVDWDDDKQLHHFLLAFETIRKTSEGHTVVKEQLQLYYEQLKQSILENDSYVDALLELSDVIYTVNLTQDVLERKIVLNGKEQNSRELFMDYPLPCSYQDYCWEYKKKITKETIAGYCMTDNCERLRKRFENGETHVSVEYCICEEDGSIRWVQKAVLMTRMVVFDTEMLAEIPMIYAIVLLQDTTQKHERDEQEQARLQAAFNEMRAESKAKTKFLSRMSHDIRTPLNGMIGLIKMNENHFDDKMLIQENHKKMKIAADYLLSLINDVLQMSKIEEGQIILSHEYICLKELAYEIESIIIHRAAEEEIQWIYEKKEAEIQYPYVYGSPLHLRQIFLNIYGNCIKYNRPGGKITTVTEVVDVQNGICTYRWTISDTGIGMSPEFLEHIFDPFSQEKTDARSVYQGTGLGMAITKGLLEQMHGSIEVTSQVGVGSVFVITIPFEIAPEQKEEEKIAEIYDIHGLHLLAAEDNELNAEIVEMLLTDDGAKVTVTQNGRQAVECFKSNPPGTFDAILMDVMMPVMDGIAATKAIRAMERADAKTIPIIAMTANAFEEDAKRCLAAGMTAHIAKPFQIEQVEKTIMESCKRKI